VQQSEDDDEMPTELLDVAMAIKELRNMRNWQNDPMHLVRVATLLRHFELILLDMMEHRQHRQ
jgi:hypothetical protein